MIMTQGAEKVTKHKGCVYTRVEEEDILRRENSKVCEERVRTGDEIM
jgi:hypothetical protein